MCPNAAYIVMGTGTDMSQCWVLPGTGVPLLHAPTSFAAESPTSAPKRWVTSAMAAVRSQSGPDSPSAQGSSIGADNCNVSSGLVAAVPSVRRNLTDD